MTVSRIDTEIVPCSLRQFLGYFLYLGTFGFGGPIALAGYMQRDLVEKRRWISKQDYLDGLALAQLAPGPLAAQLAMYLGYVHYRNLGATLVGIAFVVPSFVMVVLIGMSELAVSVHFGTRGVDLHVFECVNEWRRRALWLWVEGRVESLNARCWGEGVHLLCEGRLRWTQWTHIQSVIWIVQLEESESVFWRMR